MSGGGIETQVWVRQRIGDDLRLLPSDAKLTLLIYADSPGLKAEGLAKKTGLPMTKQTAAYELLREAGILEQVARVFYGEQFDESRWSA